MFSLYKIIFVVIISQALLQA